MKIFNGTRHKICIYSRDDTTEVKGRKLILNTNVSNVLVLEPGILLRVVMENSKLPIHLQDTGLPLKGVLQFISYDPLPEGYDLYVVSSFYRCAVKELGGDTSKLATVADRVYANGGNIKACGYTALVVG